MGSHADDAIEGDQRVQYVAVKQATGLALYNIIRASSRTQRASGARMRFLRLWR